MTRKAILQASFVFGIIPTLLVWFGNQGPILRLTREDGVIENLSVFFYMIAFVLSLVSAFRSRKVLLPVIWTLLCLIFICEETSWCQRVFDYSIPQIEHMNTQNEVNLHNLNIFQSEKISSPSFELTSLLKSQYLFRYGFFGYFLIAPLLLYNSRISSFASRINYKKPDTLFIAALLTVFILSFVVTLISPQIKRSSLCETREMLYAYFIMLNVFMNIWVSNEKSS